MINIRLVYEHGAALEELQCSKTEMDVLLEDHCATPS